MRSFRLTMLLIGAASLLFCSAALADDENPFERGSKDVFSVSLGGFLMKFNTSAQLDPEQGGSGTEIDLENQLDLDANQTRARLDGYWRFARKHRLELGGYLFNRSNTRTLDDKIVFGDTTYDVGAKLDTKFNTTLYKVAYRYSFVRNERIDFSFDVGISAFTSRLSIEGSGTINGNAGSVEESSKRVVAPIPVLGLGMDLKIVRSLFFHVTADYFQITVSDIKGHFSDARASLDWYPFKHFGFGVGYNRVGLGAKDSSGNTYEVKYTFDGLLGYATYVY